MAFVTRLSLRLGVVVLLGVVLLFGAGIFAATQVQQDLLPDISVPAVIANEPLGDLAGQLRAEALPKLKGLAGVSSVVLTGAPTDEVDVTLDPAKLAAHGVTLAQVAAALQQASIVQSVGSLRQGSATIPLQISGSLTSTDQIGKITVTPQ